MRGVFITFEGSEGSGKSTQAALLKEYLLKKNLPVVLLREPGGVAISEAVRELLLDAKNTQMTKETETLLYMASRAQLVEEVLKPALQKGLIVLCDRFLDSTIAYQGYGFGVSIEMIQTIGIFATQGIEPDLTLLFDIDVKKGLSRTQAVKDRIELRSLEYHQKVREGYLAIAKAQPGRVHVIQVDKSKEEIFEIVRKDVESFLSHRLSSL